MSSLERPRPTFSNPLPGVVLGDPFALRWRGRFYLYGTNDGPPLADGRQIPVFRSDDLVRWEPLGGALEPIEPALDHWAPEVLAWNGRFFMVVSFGDVDRRGHELWVAVADRPEGPFRMARRLSDPSEVVLDRRLLAARRRRPALPVPLPRLRRGGRPPHGTGIVVQPMLDPMTPAGPALHGAPGPLPLAPLRGRSDHAPLWRPDLPGLDDHRRPGAGPEGGAGLLRLQRRQLREGLRDRRGGGRRPPGPLSRTSGGGKGRCSGRPRAWSRGRGTSR